MLYALQRHVGGRYSTAAMPSKHKSHENISQTTATRASAHDSGADLETRKKVEEDEEEALGVLIVISTALLCSVSTAAGNTALRTTKVHGVAYKVRGRPLRLPHGAIGHSI